MTDFFIHTMFNNRHITVVIEDMIFTEDGYKCTVSIIDLDENNNLDEISEDEFIKLNPNAKEVINEILDQLCKNHKKYNYKNDKYIIIK